MGCVLRLHHMAALTAKLNRFYLIDGSVGGLTSDDDVQRRHDGEEHSHPAPGSPPIHGVGEISGHLSSSQSDANWNQYQAEEEQRGDGDKDKEPDVGIPDISTNIRGKCQ